MIQFTRRATLVALLLLTTCAPGALAAPVTVNLRVEGASRTIYDGPVTTDAGSVTTSAGGTQPCDGTGSGDGLPPGPTATRALDDGARLGGFTWDGTYGDFGIEDYFVSRVADQSADPASSYWSLWIDRGFSDKGGCQKRVSAGQEVLWALVPFSVTVPLELSAPGSARTGEAVHVRVVDGETNAAQGGATVNGVTTGDDGVATLRFADEGIYRLKAEKPGTIRSNAVSLCVDPPEAAPCSSTDKVAPVVQAGFSAAGSRLPGKTLASTRGRSRTMLISWAGQDQAGSGIAYYTVETRRLAVGARASRSLSEWRTLVDKAPVNSVHFRGEAGETHQFRITAWDRALNETTVETAPIVIPVDDRSRRLWRFSRGWKRLRTKAAWGGAVIRTTRAGATAKLRFSGTQVALIGRKLRKGGRLRLTLDGKSRTLRVRGRSAHRSVRWTATGLAAGSHTLKLTSLGGGPVELDGVAPAP